MVQWVSVTMNVWYLLTAEDNRPSAGLPACHQQYMWIVDCNKATRDKTKTMVKTQTNATTITNLPSQHRGQPPVGGPPYLTDQKPQPNIYLRYTWGLPKKHTQKDKRKTMKNAQTKATTITNLPAQRRGQPTYGWPPSPTLQPTKYTIYVDCGLP